MSRKIRVAGRIALAAAFVLVGAAATSAAEDSKSAVAARELAAVLDRLKLDSIAAADPADPGSFVAALYFPGAQLLVVSAKYSAPTLLTDKLAKKEYRDIYIDLNAASVAGSKIFVMDPAGDGLAPRAENGAADSWEQADKTIAFDGDWRAAKLSSEEEYDKAFAEADARYTHLMTVLAEQAKKSGS
jgi:hypothetical protein